MTILYSQIRGQLKTGDLVAWKPGKISSFFNFLMFLYQKILKAEYTHVGVIVVEGDRVFISEATPPVVRLFPLSMCDDFYLVQTNMEPKSSNTDILLRHIGKKYSVFDHILGIFNIRGSTDNFYCSELDAFYYNEVGFINDEDAGSTPDSLVKAVCNVTNSQPIFVKTDRGNLNAI